MRYAFAKDSRACAVCHSWAGTRELSADMTLAHVPRYSAEGECRTAVSHDYGKITKSYHTCECWSPMPLLRAHGARHARTPGPSAAMEGVLAATAPEKRRSPPTAGSGAGPGAAAESPVSPPVAESPAESPVSPPVAAPPAESPTESPVLLPIVPAPAAPASLIRPTTFAPAAQAQTVPATPRPLASVKAASVNVEAVKVAPVPPPPPAPIRPPAPLRQSVLRQSSPQQPADVVEGCASTPLDLEQIPPMAGVLLSYWRRLRGERRMPDAIDVNTAQLRDSLPRLSLFAPTADGLDFEYRSCGRAVRRRLDGAPAGRRVADCHESASAARLSADLKRCFDSATECATLVRGDVMLPGHKYVELFLPLAGADGAPAFVLTWRNVPGG